MTQHLRPFSDKAILKPVIFVVFICGKCIKFEKFDIQKVGFIFLMNSNALHALGEGSMSQSISLNQL
jgi:hypothetical protein